MRDERRTSSGWAATSARALTAPPLLAKMSTGAAAELGDDPMQVVGVLLGRRLAWPGRPSRCARRRAGRRSRRSGRGSGRRGCRSRRRPSASRSGAAAGRVGRVASWRTSSVEGGVRVDVAECAFVWLGHRGHCGVTALRPGWRRSDRRPRSGPSTMPMARTCSMASVLGKRLSMDIRVRPAPIGSIVDSDPRCAGSRRWACRRRWRTRPGRRGDGADRPRRCPSSRAAGRRWGRSCGTRPGCPGRGRGP